MLVFFPMASHLVIVISFLRENRLLRNIYCHAIVDLINTDSQSWDNIIIQGHGRHYNPPPMTLSMACSKCFPSTCGLRCLAAMRAASLHTLAMSAPGEDRKTERMFQKHSHDNQHGHLSHRAAQLACEAWCGGSHLPGQSVFVHSRVQFDGP